MTEQQIYQAFQSWDRSGQIDALYAVLRDLETMAQRMLVNALSRQVAKTPADIAAFAYLQGRLSAQIDTTRAIAACVAGEPPAAPESPDF